jgi:hypothetical protein
MIKIVDLSKKELEFFRGMAPERFTDNEQVTFIKKTHSMDEWAEQKRASMGMLRARRSITLQQMRNMRGIKNAVVRHLRGVQYAQ